LTGLSVVIPSRNGAEILKAHLPSIMGETLASGAELIVVDDCSSDGTGELIRSSFPGVRLLERTGEPGFCHAVNLGMREASGELLLLLNNDTLPLEGSFSGLAQGISRADPRTAAAVPSIPRPDGTDDSLCQWKIVRGLAVTGEGIGGAPYPSGACSLWKRSAWEELGGMDDRFAPIYWEDADLGARMTAAGMGMIRLQDLVVRHIHASTMGSSPETLALRERNRFIFMEARGVDPWPWLGIHLVSAALRGNYPFIKGYRAYLRFRRRRST